MFTFSNVHQNKQRNILVCTYISQTNRSYTIKGCVCVCVRPLLSSPPSHTGLRPVGPGPPSPPLYMSLQAQRQSQREKKKWQQLFSVLESIMIITTVLNSWIAICQRSLMGLLNGGIIIKSLSKSIIINRSLVCLQNGCVNIKTKWKLALC